MAPTSRPRVGCTATTRGLPRSSSRAMMAFCWLPPDMLRAMVTGPWPLRTSYCSMSFSAYWRTAPLSMKPGEVQHQTVLVPVLGDVAHVLAAVADGGMGDVLAAQGDVAAAGFFQAGEAVDELGLAVAVDARDAHDLARAHLKAHVGRAWRNAPP